MTNHVHLLFKTGMAPLATVMRRLLTGFAVTFNPAFSGTTAVMGSCFRIATVSKAVSLGSRLSEIGKIQKQILNI